MPLKIAVDAMGGDLGAHVVVAALVEPLKSNPNLRILLYGDQNILAPMVKNTVDSGLAKHVEIFHSSTVVNGSDKPSSIVRSGNDASMAMAIRAVAERDADICISSGNTGALMALGMHVLGTLPDISRPAICSEIPSKDGHCLLLDLGANVDCSEQQLHQFARLGARAATTILGLKSPSIRLLNIGSEAIKGNVLVQKTHEILGADSQLNYQGFIEGDGIFAGEADVVVCDGFSGNIVLKAAEGAARLIAHKADQLFLNGWTAGFFTLFLKNRLSLFKQSIHPGLYNGAYLLGLRGTIIKSHGNADSLAFEAALNMAVNYSESLIRSGS